MKGGVILFRGSGTDARRYLESDRSRADEYYLEAGTALAEFTAVDGRGEVIGELGLTADEYAQWVDWVNPLTGESMGRPRLPGEGKQGSPRFAEMVVNVPKSLSIAAALHPEVSAALDAAQRDAVVEIRSWLGQHSVTRVGPRGGQEVVPVEQLETVAVSHKTSRAGDPHRHIHFQIGTRVWAAGAWRGLDTAALFKQQGAIRALGTAVIAAHPELAAVLEEHGLTLDPVTGEVAELTPWNALMSKRSAQVARNLDKFTAEWEAAHPGEEPGPVVRARLQAKAWDHERPQKKPSQLGSEAGWLRELQDAGYTPDLPRAGEPPVRTLDDLAVQRVASRALDRCADSASAWTVHDIQEHVTRLVTEAGVRATPEALREFVTITTRLAADDCLSVLPPDAPAPEHVAHLTTLHVVAVETALRDGLAARATASTRLAPDMARLAQQASLDSEQVQAAAAIAGTEPLVVVEGAAGAGKTTMLGAAIATAARDGRAVRVVTPTKKAADVAATELGVPTDSVAKLVHEHGWRWNADGVWTRLAVGDADPLTGATYTGPSAEAQLTRGERIVVDEAGMLDQDTALALLTVADEHGANLALVGDRAQLAAIGRGGVLDIAAQLAPRVFDMTSVHRFADPDYAALTVDLRRGEHPALLFDRLHALGLIVLHDSDEDVREGIARDARDGDAITVATNDEARELNERIRDQRVRAGLVDDQRTTVGSDGLPIGRGDMIQTRHNDADVQVANRQTWTVQAVGDDGTVWATEQGTGRKHQRTVQLPAEYVTEHTHLAYAATAYGVQGATVPASHTVLSDALDAAGVYVGLTRGREANRLHIVAADLDDAREQFVAALARDRADRGLAAATQAAREAVAGLTANGPVRMVNAERARLAERIDRADREARRWESIVAALDDQAAQQRGESDAQQTLLAAAEAAAATVRAEIAAPLVAQATADGTAYLDSRRSMWEATDAHRTARGLRQRTAARRLRDVTAEHRGVETAALQRWGRLPESPAAIEPWALEAAQAATDTVRRVVEALDEVEAVRMAQQRLGARQAQERADLRRQLLGNQAPSSARAQAARWRDRGEAARRELAAIEALPPVQAAARIRARAAACTGRARSRRARPGRARRPRSPAPRLHPARTPPRPDAARPGDRAIVGLPSQA
ncbi:MobF family relaxase [Microbacterium sp. 13-71-7]|uniref:MobF family relaxase n=1 Tax=Microbacterium sp. 13-71-7 TaxID=1970399 RepID=UPI0025D70AB7|nr:MobF family relaxase [Microbacterium sp. 13-71-7]